MDHNLKACPFCGSPEVLLVVESVEAFRDDHFVECQKCEAYGPRHDSKERAVIAWNQRHDSAAGEP